MGFGQGKPEDFAKMWATKPELQGTAPQGFNSTSKEGVAMEQAIKTAYARTTEYVVQPCGIFTSGENSFPKLGSIPDGKIMNLLTGDFLGVCEFKYHPQAKHTGEIPPAHILQMMGHMALTKTDFCDYVAVYERDRKVLAARVFFNKKLWALMLSGLYKFVTHVNKIKKGEDLFHQTLLTENKLTQIAELIDEVEVKHVNMSYHAIKYLAKANK